jgi:hypothetical protein
VDKTKSSERSGPPTRFDHGVAVVPTDKVIAWLDSQKLDGSPRLLQVPVVLTRATGKCRNADNIARNRPGPVDRQGSRKLQRVSK